MNPRALNVRCWPFATQIDVSSHVGYQGLSRAVQEASSTWLMRSCVNVSGLDLERCAPGHHGYQRACDLISGQASTGPFGSPVFACAGKTDPPLSSHPLADLGGQTEPELRHR
jgi:hypothetical protein